MEEDNDIEAEKIGGEERGNAANQHHDKNR